MSTKQIPGLITLIAGLITCIISILCQIELVSFLKSMIWVIMIFYMIGCTIKFILDKYIIVKEDDTEEEKDEDEDEEETKDQEEKDSENIDKSNKTKE